MAAVDIKWLWVYNRILDSNKTELIMNLNINDAISWTSAAGDLSGYITNICLNLNAANQIVAWIDVATFNDAGCECIVRLCATESNLKAMRVAKLNTETV